MPARPNFTDVQLSDGTLRVEGRSDDEIPDLVDIRVVLVQGDRITRGSVDPGQLSAGWIAELPATDAAGSGDFTAGQAVAFGIETRSENSLTMTWTQAVTIR
jgi:hypothetical protein